MIVVIGGCDVKTTDNTNISGKCASKKKRRISAKKTSVTKMELNGRVRKRNRERKEEKKNSEFLFLFNATHCRHTVNTKSAHDLYKKAISIYSWIFFCRKEKKNNKKKQQSTAKIKRTAGIKQKTSRKNRRERVRKSERKSVGRKHTQHNTPAEHQNKKTIENKPRAW